MRTESLCIVGAGGHSKVVLEVIAALNGLRVCGVFDDDPHKAGQRLGEFEIARTSVGSLPCNNIHLAIGDCSARAELADVFSGKGYTFAKVISTLAIVSATAQCDNGVFVAPGALLAADCRVGSNSIVNHGAIVDHDARVGKNCHIAPRAVLGGAAVVEDGVLIGSGAVVLPGVRVAQSAIVAAGAVVTHHVAGSVTVAGVPAKELRQ